MGQNCLTKQPCHGVFILAAMFGQMLSVHDWGESEHALFIWKQTQKLNIYPALTVVTFACLKIRATSTDATRLTESLASY